MGPFEVGPWQAPGPGRAVGVIVLVLFARLEP